MVKFREIGTYKNAVNIGYCVASVEMHNGQVVEYDIATKTAKLPTDATKEGLALVMNSIEKPEILSPNDYVIEVGEFPRMFTLASLKDRVIDMDMDQVTDDYSDIAVGDYLVPGTDGKWTKASDVTGYAAYLEVVELTSYNGEGIGAVVKVTSV